MKKNIYIYIYIHITIIITITTIAETTIDRNSIQILKCLDILDTPIDRHRLYRVEHILLYIGINKLNLVLRYQVDSDILKKFWILR